jgi:N-acetylglucosaminyldiphosphoundecaprenol N-acetyl-beta-D-mannosaminyltransferase
MRLKVLGLPVDALSVDAAIDTIIERAADRASSAAYVVKPYVEFFGPRATAEVRAILANAWLSLPDGVALQWAAAYERMPAHRRRDLLSSLAAIVLRPAALATAIPERFAGVSFTLPLLERCRDRHLSVFLVGSPKHHAIDATAAHLIARYPGLRIAGTAPGRVDAPARESLLEQLAAARPDIILVGVGFPLQERLMAWLVLRLRHGVLIGEGGTFDFREFGGGLRRAPSPVRRLGLEWLWRLGREPSRVRRQLAIPRFIRAVHAEARGS